MSPLILRHNCLTKIQSHTESRETKNGTPTRIFRRSKFWQFYYDKKCYLMDFYGVFIPGLWTESLVFTKNKVFFRWLLCSVFITVSTYSLNVKFSSESEYRPVEIFRPDASVSRKFGVSACKILSFSLTSALMAILSLHFWHILTETSMDIQ